MELLRDYFALEESERCSAGGNGTLQFIFSTTFHCEMKNNRHLERVLSATCYLIEIHADPGPPCITNC